MSTTTVKRHTIRGGLFGAGAGLGVALILIDRKVIAIGTLAPLVVVVIGLVLGALWGSFAPAKEPKEGTGSPEPEDHREGPTTGTEDTAEPTEAEA